MSDGNRPSQAIEDLRRLAEDLIGEVSSVEARRVAFRAISAARRPSGSRLWVIGLATIGLLVISNVALAAIANSAAPGDLLYSLDRGYEWLSDRFGADDHSDERIEEAEELISEGEPALAVLLLTEALASLGSDEALQAAIVAAQAANSAGNGPTNSELKAAVEDLVEATKQISEAAHTGDQTALRSAIDAVHDRAKDVAEAAQSQGGNPNSNSPNSGQDNQPNPGVTAPGRTDEEDGVTPTSDHPGQGQGQGQNKQKSKEG